MLISHECLIRFFIISQKLNVNNVHFEFKHRNELSISCSFMRHHDTKQTSIENFQTETFHEHSVFSVNFSSNLWQQKEVKRNQFALNQTKMFAKPSRQNEMTTEQKKTNNQSIYICSYCSDQHQPTK